MPKSKDITEWRVSNAEFQGYVKAKLDDISNRLEKDDGRMDGHSQRMDKQDTKLGKIEQDISGMKISSGVFGTLGGLAGGLLGGILK